MADRKIEDLDPRMIPIVYEWETQMKDAGIDYIITCTRRTKAEQQALWNRGRTPFTPGPIVTWTLNSKHIDGLAFDFCIMLNGKPDWSMTHKDLWDKAVAIGNRLGLSQVIGKGGVVKEMAHLELKIS